MTPSLDMFDISQERDTLVVTPRTNLRELEYAKIEAGINAVLHRLNDDAVRNVILDFHRTDYFGTTALGCFLKVWKAVRTKNGSMAFCRVSDHEKEILELTKLDHLWSIYSSKEEALRAIDD